MDTDVFSVAQLRLADFIKEQRQGAARDREIIAGKMTFGDALASTSSALPQSEAETRREALSQKVHRYPALHVAGHCRD
ncbi:MAG TPA: hypothetical protein VM735_07765 [Candidatus Kapabacteria bacterium]|nr:hypothetical protein [Candidatus Kapabacteria bacterium]